MKDESRNRAALLTPPGAAAIAALRFSGPAISEFLEKHFSKRVAPHRCVHGILHDGERVIDDPVVVSHDHGVDINLHGGEWVVRECVELARRNGFEIVEDATELLESDDVIEQEMLHALPHARTEQAIRILLAQPSLWKQIKKRDVESILRDRSLWWLLNPPRIAIVGIANVGKSTLANQLFGQQRSITADVPGTTRDWVGDWANLNGLPVMLVDTPGQRDSNDSIEQLAIERSRREIQQADLLIVVLDPTQPMAAQESIRLRYVDAMIVVNKVDLPAVWETDEFTHAVRTVATSGQGVDELRRRILKRFDCDDLAAAHRPYWWTQRQRVLLQTLH
jgi:small GTP-binding protein